MRFVNLPIISSFSLVVLPMVGGPSESNFGALGKSIAQDVKAPAIPVTPAMVENNDSARTGPSSRFSPGTERSIKAEEALRQKVSFEFAEAPFSEVEQKLESMTGLNFILNQSATDDSLTPDEPISFELADAPLNKALSMLLE